MGGKRGRLEVIDDILSSTKSYSSKTEICRKANLSFEMGGKYLETMLDGGLIKFEEVKNGQIKGKYQITNKGFEFLNDCHNLKSLLSE